MSCSSYGPPFVSHPQAPRPFSLLRGLSPGTFWRMLGKLFEGEATRMHFLSSRSSGRVGISWNFLGEACSSHWGHRGPAVPGCPGPRPQGPSLLPAPAALCLGPCQTRASQLPAGAAQGGSCKGQRRSSSLLGPLRSSLSTYSTWESPPQLLLGTRRPSPVLCRREAPGGR